MKQFIAIFYFPVCLCVCVSFYMGDERGSENMLFEYNRNNNKLGLIVNPVYQKANSFFLKPT